MMEFIQRIPLLLLTAGLLIGGAFENISGSQAILAAGFVCLGAWLATEVITWYQRTRETPSEPEKE